MLHKTNLVAKRSSPGLLVSYIYMYIRRIDIILFLMSEETKKYYYFFQTNYHIYDTAMILKDNLISD